MSSARTARMMLVIAALGAAACGSGQAMTPEELAACTQSALVEGSIGGSATLISVVSMQLPDEAIAEADATADEIEATFDAVFFDTYGIHVDEFLTLRDDADSATVSVLGEPPGVGEMVSNEWLIHRDTTLMEYWNDRHPESVRSFCDHIEAPANGDT